ncbi:MAG TPA: response regulator [Gammaproteobacteria bacterium]|nr:response regulator [Gammaproteobacteria bacterium]
MTRPPHILVVDDDREIRTLLRDFLEKNGFAATAVADGQETRRALARERYDLVVLDLMLPRESGLEICRELRATSDLPVIMLTALGDEVDRVVGFEVGADDYLTKPFSPRELLGRIRAVLRRTTQQAQQAEAEAVGYRFADWHLDVTARTLTHSDGAVAALSGAEYRLLSVLLERAPRLLTRAELLSLVSGRDFDPFDRRIDVRVSRLRQTLRDDARSPRIIKTVYGEGYIIGVPVERNERSS